MNRGRISAVVHREITHRNNLAALALHLAVLLPLAAFGLGEAGPRGFALMALLVLPTLFCPLAASRVAADRERGGRRVDATTPLTPLEGLAGRAIAWILLLAVAVLGTLPALYAFTQPLAAGAFATALPLAVWAFVVGLVSLFAGSLIGELGDARSTSALASGFGLAIVWMGLAAQRGRLLGMADEGLQALVLETLVKADPIVWGLAGVHPRAIAPGPDHAAALTSLVLLAAWLALVVAGATWPPDRALARRPKLPGGARRVVLGLAAAGLLATLLLVPLPPAPPSPSPGLGTPSESGLQLETEASPQDAWKGPAVLDLSLTLRGPSEETVELQRVELANPSVAFEHDLETPRRITLDETTAEERGLARVHATGVARPSQVATAYDVHVTATVDGQPLEDRMQLTVFEWDAPTAAVLAASLAPALATGALAQWGSPRWNRW